jgi:hypothetical protein
MRQRGKEGVELNARRSKSLEKPERPQPKLRKTYIFNLSLFWVSFLVTVLRLSAFCVNRQLLPVSRFDRAVPRAIPCAAFGFRGVLRHGRGAFSLLPLWRTPKDKWAELSTRPKS